MTLTFTDELTAFSARTADPGYVALILLGTRQATTAALLIGTLAVERVAFLLTDDTRELPDDVAAMLGVSPDSWLCPEGDHSTTLAVYQGLRQALDQWSDLARSQIAVDVTGGLKPMSLGLEKAAHVLGLQTIYIQSNYGKLPDGRFGPLAGTQQLVIPPDPYVVFGDLEAAEALRLYRAHDYAGAERIYADLAARVPGDDGVRYTALAALSNMYAAWDALDFAQALAHANSLLELPFAAVPELAAYSALLNQQQRALHTLEKVSASVSGINNDDKLHTLADPTAMLPLLGTLHAAALRRAAQGRYDFAALFRYRCLELISQHRLATHGILTSDIDYKPGSAGATASSKKNKWPRGISLYKSYIELEKRADPLVVGYDITRIEKRSRARNQSVLAHGYRLIGEEEYRAFAEVVDEVLDRLFAEVLRRSRAAWEAELRFVELPTT